MIYALVAVNLFLCCIIAFLCIWINKLINKLMSRNYYDYEVTKAAAAPKQERALQEAPKINDDTNFDELAYINPV